MSSSSAKEKKSLYATNFIAAQILKKTTLRLNNKNINYDNNIRNIFNNALY